MNKETALLRLLKEKNEILSATKLSEALNVSTRTIRNYIKRINELLPEAVILATPKGYYLNDEMYQNALFLLEDTAAKTVDERVEFLINAILRQDKKSDLFTLAQDLNVSEATIISDLTKIEKTLVHYQLKLHRDKQTVWISGSERRKRSLIRKIYSREIQDQMYNFFANQDILTDEQVVFLRGILIKNLDDNKIEMNDFSLSNVLLHLMIAIARIQGNQAIEDTKPQELQDHSVEYVIARKVFQEIEPVFGISANVEEIQALKLLLIGNTMKKDDVSLISAEIKQLTEKIIAEVNHVYLINLDDAGFMMRFSIHLENLLKRRRNDITNPNPMLDILKKGHPMIYDVGLFIGRIIETELGIGIPEEEVAFISLHIGSFVNEKDEQEGVSVTIIAPNYNLVKEQVLAKLETEFESRLVIKNIVTTYVQASQQFPTDLVISTVPYQGIADQKIVFVTPFFSAAEMKKIESAIVKIERRKKIRYYQDLASTYFSETAFFYDISLSSKEQIIRYVGDQLVKEGIITDEYVLSVLEREQMSPTLFAGVAIPHSLYRNAVKSQFAVFANPDKIVWGDGTAELVLFMTVNNENQESINDFLQLLIGILSEKSNLKQLSSKTSYRDFLESLKQLIQEYLESE